MDNESNTDGGLAVEASRLVRHFFVTRTSLWYDEKPCDDAKRTGFGDDQKWCVTADLIEFIDKHGKCVVCTDRDGYIFVEIYDNYREQPNKKDIHE